MGSSQIRNNNEEPNLSLWEIKEKHNNMTIWRKRDESKLQMEEYPLYLNDEKQFQREKSLYFIRKDHLWLVASKFFKEQKNEQFCSSTYKGNLFIQRIPVKLSNVTDIPFPDILHLYNQALNGFNLLSSKAGFFFITEENIGITQDGRAKVWLNKDFQKSFPSQQQCSQQAMVRNIIEIIEHNTDPDSIRNRSIIDYIYTNSKNVSFRQAINKLNSYAAEFNNGQIPAKLNCVSKAGGTQVLMKQYRINNQKSLGSSQHNQEANRATPQFYQNNNPPQPYYSHQFSNVSSQPDNKINIQRKNTIVEKINQQPVPNTQTVIKSSFYNESNKNKSYNSMVPLVQVTPASNDIAYTLNPSTPPLYSYQGPSPVYNQNHSYKVSENSMGTWQPTKMQQLISHVSTKSQYPSPYNIPPNNMVIEKLRNHPMVQIIQNSSASQYPIQSTQNGTNKPSSNSIKRMENVTDQPFIKTFISPIPPAELATGIPIHRSQKKIQIQNLNQQSKQIKINEQKIVIGQSINKQKTQNRSQGNSIKNSKVANNIGQQITQFQQPTKGQINQFISPLQLQQIHTQSNQQFVQTKQQINIQQTTPHQRSPQSQQLQSSQKSSQGFQSQTIHQNNDKQQIKRQQNVIYVQNLKNIPHHRVISSQTPPQTIITSNNTHSQNTVINKPQAMIGRFQNNNPQTTIIKKQVQNNSRVNNDNSVPQISEISSIGRNLQANKIHKNILSQNRFSEIRGQSINDSTVNFYNSFVNKEEEESNAQWQDYTQAQSQFLKAKTPNIYYHNYNQPQNQINNKQTYAYDGTSQQFLNQLKNVHESNSHSGSPSRIQTYNYQAQNYQARTYNPVSYNQYEPTYTSQGHKNASDIKYDSKNVFQSQPTASERDVSPIGTFKEVELAPYNNQRKNDEYEYRFYSDNNNNSINNRGAIFYADSFGINNPKAATLEQNLEMKYSMTQDEEYHVDWDPQILADLQSLQH